MRKAGADAARINEPAVIIISNDQRPDRVRHGGRRRIAAHGEFLRIGAFRLDENVRPAAAISRLGALGDNAFKPDIAGMLQDKLAALLEMLATSDRPMLLAPNEPRELRFALDERQAREIAPVTMEEIENVIDKSFPLAGLERSLQPGKARNAVCFLDHDLAVDERGARRQPRHGGRDISKFAGPVEALAREQLDLAMLEPRLNAIAVKLDLMHPALARGWLLAQRCERRRQKIGQPRTRLRLVLLDFALLFARLARASRRSCGCTRRGRTLAATRLHARARCGRSLGRAGFHVVLHAAIGMPDSLSPFAFGDLGHGAAAHHRERFLLEDVGVIALARGFIARLDQQP